MHATTHTAPPHAARRVRRGRRAREGGAAMAPLCIIGSVLVHAAAFASVQVGHGEGMAADAEAALVDLTFAEVAPEPEPEITPVAPEPEPVRQPAIVHERVKPEPRPEPVREAPPEPELAKASIDDDAATEADDDSPLEEEATADSLVGHGIATVEGGLRVGVRGGDGSGLRGGDSVRAGRPVPKAPTVDLESLARAWVSQVGRIINQRAGRDYPLSARRRNMTGVAVMALYVDAQGQITAVEVKRSSGHGVLDKAALAAVSKVGSVPPPPSALNWKGNRPIAMPVAYRLQ
jgi:periplasmic protein TonB